MEPPQLLAILGVVLSALLLFLLSSYEATFIVISRSYLEKLAENKVSRARRMLYIYEPRHRLRLMTRLGAAFGTVLLTLSILSLVYRLCTHYGFSISYSATATVVLTQMVFLLVSVPRRIRFEDDGEDPLIPFIALTFVPLHTLLLPLTDLLNHFTSGDYSDEDFRAEKEEELRSLVESESESGVIEEGEREMIQGVFGFHDRIVREVMVPRVDIEAIEASSTLNDLLQHIKETGHSRLPLYEETLDRIGGLIYAKDLLHLLVGREDLNLNTPIVDFISQESSTEEEGVPFVHAPFFVPETRKIDDLLHDLRASKIRLAVVVDEYGGTAGIVSTEDLVEEIVGDIQDEYDDEEELFYWVDPEDILIVNARIDIDDLNEVLETDLPNEGFETLGGFIYDFLGRVPDEGQTFQTANLELKILKVEGQRIAQVQIRRLSRGDDDETEESPDP